MTRFAKRDAAVGPLTVDIDGSRRIQLDRRRMQSD